MANMRRLAAGFFGGLLVLGAAAQGAEDPRLSEPAKLEKLQQELLKRNMGELLNEFKTQHPGLKPLTPAQLIPVVEDQIAKSTPDEQRAGWDQLLELYRKWIADNEKNYKERLVYRYKFSNALQKAAEEYINAILLRGGSPDDYKELNKLAEELVKLLAQNAKIFDEIEQNANAQNAKPEQIEELDKKNEYLISQDWDSAWAKFYLALSLSNDPAKAAEVKKLAGEAAAAMEKKYDPDDANSSFLDKPNSVTGMQYEASILYGMCQRLMGNWDKADKAFDLVVHSPEDAKTNVLKFKARIEQVKVERDKAKTSAELDSAAKDATELLTWIDTTSQGKIPIFKVVCLLLQSNVLSKKADMAQKENKPAAEVAKLREQAFEPLAKFAQDHQDMLGLLNEEVFKLLSGENDPKKLSSFGLQAKVAIHLSRAYALEDEAKARKDEKKAKEAVEEYKKLLPYAEELRQRDDAIAKSVKTIALFNLALAYSSLAKETPAYKLQSAQTFYEMAEINPHDPNAQRALEEAIETLSEMRAAKTANEQSNALFYKAVKLLGDTYPKSKFSDLAVSDKADGERLKADNMVADVKRPDSVMAKSQTYLDVAKQYEQVPVTHPRYEYSQHMRLLCLMESARLYALICSDANKAVLKERVEGVVGAALNENKLMTKKAEAAKDPKEKQGHLEMASNALIIAANTEMFEKCMDPKKALEILDGFEKKYPEAKEAIGQALRIRINAMQKLGMNKEAGGLIDDYMKIDPEGSGRVIQGLLSQAQAELKQAQKDKKDPKDILALKKEIKDRATNMVEWVEKNKKASAEELYTYRYIKAIAFLDSAESKDEFGEAKKLLDALLQEKIQEGSKFKEELQKAKEENQQLLAKDVTDPANEKARADLKVKIATLEDKVNPPVYLLKGIADATYGAGDFEAARKLYAEIQPRLPKTDNKYFEVQLMVFKTQLAIADSAASQPSDSQAAATQPKGGSPRDKLRNAVATEVDRLLKIDTSNLGGLRGEFELLREKAGGEPVKISGVATDEEKAAKEKAEAEEQAREELELSQKHKKMFIAFGIFGAVAVGLGILSWMVIKRKSRYMKAAHPHLKHPLHHGELTETQEPIALDKGKAGEGETKPKSEGTVKPKSNGTAQPKTNGDKPAEGKK